MGTRRLETGPHLAHSERGVPGVIPAGGVTSTHFAATCCRCARRCRAPPSSNLAAPASTRAGRSSTSAREQELQSLSCRSTAHPAKDEFEVATDLCYIDCQEEGEPGPPDQPGREGSRVARVATTGYTEDIVGTGIRELKDNLSAYIRRVEAGERVSVTAHGRVVAELVPPGTGAKRTAAGRWEELIAAGVLHPPVETGDPFEDWPDIRLPRGTAAALIDSDRGEA